MAARYLLALALLGVMSLHQVAADTSGKASSAVHQCVYAGGAIAAAGLILTVALSCVGCVSERRRSRSVDPAGAPQVAAPQRAADGKISHVVPAGGNAPGWDPGYQAAGWGQQPNAAAQAQQTGGWGNKGAWN
ncbi:hypothetical protein Agub_g844 [Astrephomene gubernaculifera]|uniref:Uncharacterized protein n=1 Tax=Astrephomene gubernaculifera TaxID=47775 RepID=A0AAD3HH92_9CHLO|nr:hypothetical protein Agub_g844 [Astrephomene gubernaculifera]